MLSPYKSGKFRLTSSYGNRVHPINGRFGLHGGIDLVCIGDGLVTAVASGTVVRSRIVTDRNNSTWQWGEYIAVTGEDGVTVYYCHLSRRTVVLGERVTVGQVIGEEGSSGYATGRHLHFETRQGERRINAADYIGIPNKPGTYGNAAASLPDAAESAKPVFAVGDLVRVRKPLMYNSSRAFRLYFKTYEVIEVRGDRIVIGVGGVVTAPVNAGNLEPAV